MNKRKFFLCLISVSILCVAYNSLGISDQEVLKEFARWTDILGLKDISMQPPEIHRAVHPAFKRVVIDVFGGTADRLLNIQLTFDIKTGELIAICNGYQSRIEEDAEAAGKKITFSLDKETCKNQLIKYYKLITGEEPPPFEIRVPAKGTLLPPTYTISLGWRRMYKGYRIRDNYTVIDIFADTGTLASYQKRFISDLPPTVEVKITAEQARQKAVEIADREIKDWVQFLDSISTETAISQLDDKIYRGIKSTLKGKSRQIKQESQQYASLIGCKPIEVKAPYLEIVNIREDAFNRQYMQPEAYEKSHKWNPATRLCWVITLYYQNPETKVGAQFEVDIDAYDGSVVNGSRPWD